MRLKSSGLEGLQRYVTLHYISTRLRQTQVLIFPRMVLNLALHVLPLKTDGGTEFYQDDSERYNKQECTEGAC